MKLAWIFALFAVCCLSPYLVTGYYQDDSLNSLLRTYLQERHVELGPFIWNDILHWATHEARLFPLTVALSYSIWYFVQDLLTYRILQVMLVLSNLLLFVKLLRAMGGSQRSAFLAGLIALGLFQLRDFHDPITSYACLMQINLGLGMGAVLLLRQYRDRQQSWRLGASLALYLSCLLYYEVAFAFIPILFYLAATFPRARNRQRVLAGYGSITVAYFGLVAFLRLNYPAYEGIKSNLRPKALATFAFQLSAALPLAYPIFGRSGFYTFETLMSREFLTWTAFGVLLAGIAICLCVLKMPGEKPKTADRRELLIMGWSLVLIPALLVAISQKYQDLVTRPGIGYLPVYFSYFGVALLLALVLERARRPRLVSVALATLVAFTFSVNWIAAGRLNEYWKDPRVLMEKALRQGLLADLPPGARVITSSRYDWASVVFFLHNSGKRVEIGRVDDYAPSPPPTKDYFLEVVPQGSAGGVVTLAAIKGSEPAPPGAPLPIHILTDAPQKTMRF